jgi:hypothetical protein
MDPWYETAGPSETDVRSSMQKSHIYICLHKEINTEEENKFLCQIASNTLRDENLKHRDKINVPTSHNFLKITFESIRQNPKWKEISQQILKEEVISHQPYGSWRGFSTFVIGPLRERFIVRLIREIWAPHIINTKFTHIWIKTNYSPDNKNGQGYQRTKEHYYSIS